MTSTPKSARRMEGFFLYNEKNLILAYNYINEREDL